MPHFKFWIQRKLEKSVPMPSFLLLSNLQVKIMIICKLLRVLPLGSLYYDFTHKFSAALFPTVMCLWAIVVSLKKNLRDSQHTLAKSCLHFKHNQLKSYQEHICTFSCNTVILPLYRSCIWFGSTALLSELCVHSKTAQP